MAWMGFVAGFVLGLGISALLAVGLLVSVFGNAGSKGPGTENRKSPPPGAARKGYQHDP